MGSNIDPETNLRAAADLLRGLWSAIRFSSVYLSPAAERVDQPDFLNAAAQFETIESPEVIQAKLQTIEATLKKNPPYRFGPRTIDLDLLLIGSMIRTESPLLPHPRLHERRFVLEPLTKLGAGNLLHPVLKKTLSELLKEVSEQSCAVTKLRL